MPIDSKECFTNLTTDGQLYEIYLAAQSGGGGGGGSPTGPAGGDLTGTYPNPTVDGLRGRTISTTAPTNGQVYQYDTTSSQWVPATITATGTAGGDLTGTYPNPTVDGLQGRPVSNATPYNGQVLQYDGASWVPGTIPSGGSGGGGVIYYLNFNTAADAPLTNIPQTPNTSKELGLVGDVTGTSYLSPILSTTGYDRLATFVTDVSTPSATAIPAGIWDFNLFIESTTTNSSNQIYFKVEILKYDGTNAPTFIAQSNDTYIYDPAEINQYIASVVMPQTTILSTDRIVVYLYGSAHQNNNRLTFYFGGAYPSHTHSTMPSVTGTGVAKVVNGVFQSPASTIVNADVSASAAIEVSKLSQATNRILGRTTAGTGSVEELSVAGNLTLASGTLTSKSPQIDIYTSSTTWTKPVDAKSVNIILLGGGGGGGGGGRNTLATTFRSGGGGGGGGGFLNVTVPASILPSTPINITIGAGGAGGAGSTTNAAGTAGTQGGDTIFGTGVAGTITYISTGGIQGGGGAISAGGATTGTAGGGTLNAHSGGAGSSTNGAGGAPTSAVAAHMMGGAGGAGGAGINDANNLGTATSGGRSNILNLSGGTLNNNGISNTNAINGWIGVGSGGGGGLSSLTNANSGGNGGFPSSGGGGGGASQNGNAGNGGQGGAGMAIITTYF